MFTLKDIKKKKENPNFIYDFSISNPDEEFSHMIISFISSNCLLDIEDIKAALAYLSLFACQELQQHLPLVLNEE